MPHLTIQATANVVIEQPQSLLQTLNQALWDSGEFVQSAEIKSRIMTVNDFLVGIDVGDNEQTQGFVYTELKVMAGRNEETKQYMANLVMAGLQQYFSQQSSNIAHQVDVQLCVEVVEISSVYQKQSLSL
ncbi:5-carboxymethyl-2-hydroxymuconate Delta-isomerase [Psychrobacter sp. I-STPA10]|uniref:5-carboxymethyl-2-hydroxymuconate Delta-isomerase n=1 Tax=Psychrobacter sp. I-STPA10 TaxID=2585769 RepID=UPI001E33E187|nr:5-carboxymethyl-2-hydroxymuconate Delta-isomerase [Psychrobacter sp. I-STPA10]